MELWMIWNMVPYLWYRLAIYLEENLQDWYQGCKRKDVQYRRQDIEQNRKPQILLVWRDESA